MIAYIYRENGARPCCLGRAVSNAVCVPKRVGNNVGVQFPEIDVFSYLTENMARAVGFKLDAPLHG